MAKPVEAGGGNDNLPVTVLTNFLVLKFLLWIVVDFPTLASTLFFLNCRSITISSSFLNVKSLYEGAEGQEIYTKSTEYTGNSTASSA